MTVLNRHSSYTAVTLGHFSTCLESRAFTITASHKVPTHSNGELSHAELPVLAAAAQVLPCSQAVKLSFLSA